MKHKVKSKLADKTARRRKKMYKFSDQEERVANILLHKSEPSSTCEIEEPKETITLSEDDEVEEAYIDIAPIDLEIDIDPNVNDDYDDVYEQYQLSPSQNPPIGICDTQEESQMSISKSLQDICQQNAEILTHVRQTYHLMAEESKRKQAYQSTKLTIYRRELELLQNKSEMQKLTSFSNINI